MQANGLQEAVGRLVLSRKDGESVDVGGLIRFTLVNSKKGFAKILIEAPKDIHVKRTELVGDDGK
jgi:carbon storage regulator CsrA